jgi:hypothetical protein
MDKIMAITTMLSMITGAARSVGVRCALRAPRPPTLRANRCRWASPSEQLDIDLTEIVYRNGIGGASPLAFATMWTLYQNEEKSIMKKRQERKFSYQNYTAVLCQNKTAVDRNTQDLPGTINITV